MIDLKQIVGVQALKGKWLGSWGAASAPNSTTTVFPQYGILSLAFNGGEAAGCIVMPEPIVVTDIFVHHITALATASMTYVIRKNFAAVGAGTVVVAGGTTANNASGLSIAFAQGDVMSFQGTESAAQIQAALGCSISLRYEST
jgi:hypothetical protein